MTTLRGFSLSGVLTSLLLACARPCPAAHAGGPACKLPEGRVSQLGRIALWAATILVVGFLCFPYVAAYLLG